MEQACEWVNGTENGLLPQDGISEVLSLALDAWGNVYAAGFRTDSSGVIDAGYWENGVWNGGMNGPQNSFIYSLVISGNDIYAGGSVGIPRDPGYWKNGIWNALPLLDNSQPGGVTCMVVSGTDIYAGGNCNSSPSVSIPGYWKNGTWNGLATQVGEANALVVSGTDVYVGGSIGRVPGYWKNGTWNALPPLDTNTSSDVWALAVSGSDVYAGGCSQDSNGPPNSIAGYWKNGTWNALSTLSGEVHSLVVSGTDVYAAGRKVEYFPLADAYEWVPGDWKNGTWNELQPQEAGDEDRWGGLLTCCSVGIQVLVNHAPRSASDLPSFLSVRDGNASRNFCPWASSVSKMERPPERSQAARTISSVNAMPYDTPQAIGESKEGPEAPEADPRATNGAGLPRTRDLRASIIDRLSSASANATSAARCSRSAASLRFLAPR